MSKKSRGVIRLGVSVEKNEVQLGGGIASRVGEWEIRLEMWAESCKVSKGFDLPAVVSGDSKS